MSDNKRKFLDRKTEFALNQDLSKYLNPPDLEKGEEYWTYTEGVNDASLAEKHDATLKQVQALRTAVFGKLSSGNTVKHADFVKAIQRMQSIESDMKTIRETVQTLSSRYTDLLERHNELSANAQRITRNQYQAPLEPRTTIASMRKTDRS